MMKGDGENFIRFQMTGRDWHKDVQSTKLGVSGPLAAWSTSSTSQHKLDFETQTPEHLSFVWRKKKSCEWSSLLVQNEANWKQLQKKFAMNLKGNKVDETKEEGQTRSQLCSKKMFFVRIFISNEFHRKRVKFLPRREVCIRFGGRGQRSVKESIILASPYPPFPPTWRPGYIHWLP